MRNIRHLLVTILCIIAANAYGFDGKHVCYDHVDMPSEFDGHVNIGLSLEAFADPIYYHDTKSHIMYEINIRHWLILQLEVMRIGTVFG